MALISIRFLEKNFTRFFDSSLIHLRLVELAVRRACSDLSPKVTVNFLETYPISRACYSGTKQSGKGTIRIAMQHASRNVESMFYLSHPTNEYAVGVDNETLPKADYQFVMGDIAARMMENSGYPEDRIKLTGSHVSTMY